MKILNRTFLSHSTLKLRKKKKNKATVKPSSPENIMLRNRKDAVSLAVHHISKCVGGTATSILLADDSASLDNIYLQSNKYHLPDAFLPYGGFARRDNDNGDDLFGARYIGMYKDLIEDLIKKGNEDSAMKGNPTQMLETIKVTFPDRFLYPSEYEISSFVNSFLTKEKNKPLIKNSHSAQSRRQKRCNSTGCVVLQLRRWRDVQRFGDLDVLMYSSLQGWLT